MTNQTLKEFRRMFGIQYEHIEAETSIPRHSWASYESGRLRLKEKSARRLSEVTGLSISCLLAGDGRLLNTAGIPYSQVDFAAAKALEEPNGGWNSLSNRARSKSRLLAVWFLLDLCDDESLATGIGLGRFQGDLERFALQELSRFPSLKKRYLYARTATIKGLLEWLKGWQADFEKISREATQEGRPSRLGKPKRADKPKTD
jgi:hypothetical protein